MAQRTKQEKIEVTEQLVKNLGDSDLQMLVVCIPRWDEFRFEVSSSENIEDLPD